NVAVTETDGDRDGDRYGNDREHGRLETRTDTRQHCRCWAGARRLRDLPPGRGLRGRLVLREPAHRLSQDQPDGDSAEDLPALVAVVVADVGEGDDQGADDREQASGEEAAVDRG